MRGTIVLQGIALLWCGGALMVPASAETRELAGVDLWVTTADAAVTGPSLLRPPASWSWDDGAQPKLDFAAGIERNFMNGLTLDAGVSVAHTPEYSLSPSVETINYHDYFLGMRYGALDGRVWYLPEKHLGEPVGFYYEAGWQQLVTDSLSLSVRVGHYSETDQILYSSQDVPSLSLGASTTVQGYGLGLRLIDGGGQMFGGEQDLRLMGSISKPLR
jgi:hypothetical protein